MKEKITKNKTVFTGIIITFIFVLTLIGVSFAYFVTQVTGEGKDVDVYKRQGYKSCWNK